MGEPHLSGHSGQAGVADAQPALLATMHGKERVIAPLLRPLGLAVVTADIDTDRFGTFSREVPRVGSALDAARAKIATAFACRPDVRVALASEGSFGPHPVSPLLPLARELVVLRERDTDLEVCGEDVSTLTNYAQVRCDSTDAALAFARRSGFPQHGVLVMACVDGEPAPQRAVHKDLNDVEALRTVVAGRLRADREVFLETDMRAHRNPTRMAAIARATQDLAQRLSTRCPACARPGFGVTGHEPGLPCADCGAPTRRIRADILRCAGCGHVDLRPVAVATADPAACDGCNP